MSKAKVEQAVLIVERWLLGRLRRRVFHSLADVDAALGEFMIQLNERQPLRRLAVTRRQLLEEIDRPALRALPDEPYEYSEWRLPRVGVDYHVEIDAHYGSYSVIYCFGLESRRVEEVIRCGLRTFRVGWAAIAGLSAEQRGEAVLALAKAEERAPRRKLGARLHRESDARSGRRTRLELTSVERVESRGCPHCAGREIVGWGRWDGAVAIPLQESCGRTFKRLDQNADRRICARRRSWLAHAQAMIEGTSVAKAAELLRCPCRARRSAGVTVFSARPP